jgi:hypothetical protein
MDGQHQYEITLKKDDLFINLSSDDVYFISKQMDKWFRILLDDSYVPVTLPQRPQPEPEATTAPAVPETPQPVTPQPAVEAAPPAPVPVAPPAPEVASLPVQEPVAPVVEAPAVQPAVSQHADVNLPLAQPPAPTQPQPAPVAETPPQVPVAEAPPVDQPAPAEAAFERQPHPPQQVATATSQPAAISDTVNDDFEAVMDTLMKDLESSEEEAFEPVYAVSGTNGSNSVNAAVANGNNGAEALAISSVSVVEGAGDPDLAYITSLADLCDRSNASNSEDYLLLSAYYLTRVERQEAFSLKKVNSVLVKSGLTPINHSVLEAVLSRGHLVMVPDLTGTAEVSEYSITPDGQQAAMQLL